MVSRRTEDGGALYRWRKGVAYTTMALGVLLVGRIWLAGSGSLATYLGLLSAALVIALQDPISNIVGWAFLVSRRPFEVDDRIEIGEFAGDVIDLRAFQFTLMEIRNWVDADQSTGRVLHLPNKKVVSAAPLRRLFGRRSWTLSRPKPASSLPTRRNASTMTRPRVGRRLVANQRSGLSPIYSQGPCQPGTTSSDV
jgi:small-conductance mechanosensitive channel